MESIKNDNLISFYESFDNEFIELFDAELCNYENYINEAFSYKAFKNQIKQKFSKNKVKIEDFREKHQDKVNDLKDKYEKGNYSKDFKGFKKFYNDNKDSIDDIWHYAKPFLGGLGIILATTAGGAIYLLAYFFLELGIINWFFKDIKRSKLKKAKAKDTDTTEYTEYDDITNIKQGELPAHLEESLVLGFALFLVGMYFGKLLIAHIKIKKDIINLINKIESTNDPVKRDKLKEKLSKLKNKDKQIEQAIIEKERELKEKNIKLTKEEKAKAKLKVDKYKKEIEKLEQEIKKLKNLKA
jgi:hypothetical protein